MPVALQAQTPSQDDTEDRLRDLESRQLQFEKLLEEKEARIRELEADTGPEDVSPPQSEATSPAGSEKDANPFGEFTPGQGFTVARTDFGELQLSVYSYFRYLNQKGLDSQYIDHFGNTQTIDQRHDFEVNKVFLYTKGWFLDPDFKYLFYVWSSNTALGKTSNNLVAGNLRYRFSDAFSLTGGVVGLPSTRSMMGQFPYWHRVDTRLIADEFMRGSFTQGISA
ncbi:MAG: hypothetical protein PVG13_08600, partial [Thiohalophilus sp.]